MATATGKGTVFERCATPWLTAESVVTKPHCVRTAIFERVGSLLLWLGGGRPQQVALTPVPLFHVTGSHGPPARLGTP